MYGKKMWKGEIGRVRIVEDSLPSPDRLWRCPTRKWPRCTAVERILIANWSPTPRHASASREQEGKA